MFSWLRYDGEGQMIACITNFSSEPRPDYRIGLPAEGVWKEILNTDAEVYDGTGAHRQPRSGGGHPVPSHGYVASAAVTIPPLGAVWLRFEPVSTEEQPRAGEGRGRRTRGGAKQASPHRTTVESTGRRGGRRAVQRTRVRAGQDRSRSAGRQSATPAGRLGGSS